MNVKEYTQEALHNKIGYVSQKAILFSGTIADNVAYGENGKAPATQDDIAMAVKVAQASEFVEKKDQGYDGVFQEIQKTPISISYINYQTSVKF